jgi:hypothetical protein
LQAAPIMTMHVATKAEQRAVVFISAPFLNSYGKRELGDRKKKMP